jgi:hypothetical protein
MIKTFSLFVLLGLTTLAQTTNISLVTSNSFRTYVDTRLTKPTNGLVVGQVLGVKAGLTNLEYKTLVAGPNVTIVHSDTNITIGQVFTNASLGDGSVSAPTLNFSSQTNNGFYLNTTNGIGVTIQGTNQLNISTSGIKIASLDTNGVVYSATYSPTLGNFDIANVNASTDNGFYYTRIGSLVTVYGTVTIDPTAAALTLTTLSISLPIASTAVSGVKTTYTGDAHFVRAANGSNVSEYFSGTIDINNHLNWITVNFFAAATDDYVGQVRFSYRIND